MRYLQCDWSTLGPAAAAHASAHWLREYLGEAHDKAAAEQSEISWINLPNWPFFKAENVGLPQSAADLPRFVALLLENALMNQYGSYEIQYVLDAIFRNAIIPKWNNDEEEVTFNAVLQAVHDADFLSKKRFARFQALFEYPLPLITVTFSKVCGKEVAQFSRRWHSVRDYLEADPKAWTPKQHNSEAHGKKRKCLSSVNEQVDISVN